MTRRSEGMNIFGETPNDVITRLQIERRELAAEMKRLFEHFETWARDHSADATAETWAIIHCSRAILDKFGV